MSVIATMARIARDWSDRCFGADHTTNLPIRGLRTLEEAAEAAQALHVPEETAVKCVRTVYSRPIGEPQQEIGGILLTTVILCEAMGLDPVELLERELRRVLKKSPEHFAKRNQEKIDLGLTASAREPGDVKAPHPGGGWPLPDRAFFQLCTRTDHICACLGEGPCNGLPRDTRFEGDERARVARMYQNPSERALFDKAFVEHGWPMPPNPDLSGRYRDHFDRWGVAQLRRSRASCTPDTGE